MSSGALGTVTAIDTYFYETPIITGAPHYPFQTGTYIGNRTVVLLGESGATIVDLTDPANPAIQGNVTFPTATIYGGYSAYYSASRGLVYLVASNNFYVLSVSDPASSRIEATVALPPPLPGPFISVPWLQYLRRPMAPPHTL